MTISKPSVSINLIPANLSISTGPQRVLLVGQMLTGTAISGELTQDLGNANEQDALFGKDSMLASMVRAFRKINKVTPIDAIALADANGTPAAGSIAFTGTATAAGTLYITVGSSRNHRYSLDISSGQTATTVGAALAALINADLKLPFTAAAVTGTVTITAKHDGTEYNGTQLRLEGNVAGVSATLSAFSAGATNPTLTNILQVCADQRYQTIVWPTTYAITEVITNFLEPRFNVNNDVLDGIAIQSLVDSKADLKTAVNALNYKTLVIQGLKEITDTYWKGNMAQEFPCVVSSQIAALRSLRLTEGANVAAYVTTTTGSLDTFGGPALASLPYFNTPLDDIDVIPVGKGWTPAEVEEFIAVGISTFGNNRSKNKVILGDIVTTYKTDNAGNVDPTFSYLNNVDVSSTVREYYVNNIRKQYAQTRLTQGDLVPNRSMANEKSIGAYLDQLYNELAGSDYVLLQKGETARKFFKESRTVTLDLVNGRVTITMQVPIVTQLREIIATMQIAFSTT